MERALPHVASSTRPHWLGAAVLVHLVAISLQAFPSPAGGLSQASWADPTVQDELRQWSANLWFLGWDADELEARTWALANAWEQARDFVLRPLKPYYRYTGSWQNWKMFIAPHTHPTRLEIEVERADGWFLAYEERSDAHDWLRAELDDSRVRALVFRMGWPQYGPLRRQFAHWVAARAAREWPDASRVKVWFRKEVTPSAEEVRAGKPLEWTAVMPIIQPVPR